MLHGAVLFYFSGIIQAGDNMRFEWDDKKTKVNIERHSDGYYDT